MKIFNFLKHFFINDDSVDKNDETKANKVKRGKAKDGKSQIAHKAKNNNDSVIDVVKESNTAVSVIDKQEIVVEHHDVKKYEVAKIALKTIEQPAQDIDNNLGRESDAVSSDDQLADHRLGGNNTDQTSQFYSSLKDSFDDILRHFNKTYSQQALYEHLGANEDLKTKDVIKLAKKCNLVAKLRRVNILDIDKGPGILLLSDNKYAVFTDVIDNKELVREHYIGYVWLFYEDDMNLANFFKRNNFLFQDLNKFWSMFIEILVISVFINLFAVVSPFFTMIVYDRVIPNYAMDTLTVLAIGVFIVYIFDFIFKLIRMYLIDGISSSIGNEVDQLLLSKIVSVKSPGLSMTKGAQATLFKELSMIREFYFSKFIPSLIDLPFVIFFIFILLLISPWVALIPLVAGILIFVVNVLIQVPLQNAYIEVQNEDNSRAGLLNEVISGAEHIKMFNASGKFLSKWRRLLAKTYEASIKYNLLINGTSNFSLLVVNIVTLLVIVVGVYEISNNVMTTGGIIASTTLSSRIMTNIIGFANLVVRYKSINTTLNHLEGVINLPSEDCDRLNYSVSINGDIVFKDVFFMYPSLKRPVLNNCNFTIEQGSKVGIIGKTGMGKSTITKLLMGTDFVNKGQILIDGYDIHHYNIVDIRNNIGFMPQKSYFFRGTMRENILLNHKNVTQEQYELACQLAGVELITEYANQGDSLLIEENGDNLSGGQQQIIAFARAIVNNPPIVIMDEPTNGMDSSLEVNFVNNVRNYVKDKTFILITHKPSQLTLVDKVIVLDNGAIVLNDTKDKVINMLSKNPRN